MSSHVETSAVDELALGCDLLGSGGGGSTHVARLILHQHVRDRPVTVTDDVAPGTQIACVGAYGSATLMLESLPNSAPFEQAVRTLVDRFGSIEALMPLEMGGVNGLLAVLAASALGMELVDADPMGRAFTQLDKTVLAAHVPVTALAFSSTGGESAYFEASTGEAIERMVRSILPSVGGWGAVACHAGSADRLIPAAVSGTVTQALQLGGALSRAIAGDPDRFLECDGVRLVFDGTVTGVSRRPGIQSGGVASLRHRIHRNIGRLDFANEYVAFYDDGELTAAAPDLVCVLDECWTPVPTDQLTDNQQVHVVAIEAAEDLLDAHARTRQFGLESHGFSPVGSAR